MNASVSFLNYSGGKGYDPEKRNDADFISWLQCYCVDGMKAVRDRNGRTVWFNVRNWKCL